jgi:hypothetical protein
VATNRGGFFTFSRNSPLSFLEDIMRDNYQTDFEGHIRKDGCLFFSIIKAATDIAGKGISHNGILGLIDELHLRVKTSYNAGLPAISNENNHRERGVFVWDHEAVFNTTLIQLGSAARVRYVGRIYMPWEEERGKITFGTRSGELIILQIKTIHGNGHFRLPNWDPWRSSTIMTDLKSLRYYRVIGA